MKPLIYIMLLMLPAFAVYSETDGVPALDLSVFDTEDPIKVGYKTVYIFEIRNEGSGAASNVKIEFTPTPEIKIMEVKPGEGILTDGNKIKPVSVLNPGEKMRVMVVAEAIKQGTAIFRITVNYAESTRDIVVEEPTTIQ